MHITLLDRGDGKALILEEKHTKGAFLFKQILAARPGSGRLAEKGVPGESSGGQVV